MTATGRHAGFTMIEVLMVIAIIAVFAAFAMPSFQSLMAYTRTAGIADELIASLQLARSEAVRTGAVVSVCRSANANDALPTCGTAASAPYAANDWGAGWVVFAKDPTGTGSAAVVEASDTVLRRQAAARRVTVNPASSSGVGVITYGGLGRPLTAVPTATGTDIAFWVDALDASSNVLGAHARCIKVGFTGRIEVGRNALNQCGA